MLREKHNFINVDDARALTAPSIGPIAAFDGSKKENLEHIDAVNETWKRHRPNSSVRQEKRYDLRLQSS
jgi:hypothetical protein